MHLKIYIFLALVLVLAVGMGCSSGTSSGTSTGTGGDPSLYGTWNLASSSGGTYPQKIIFNSTGTGQYQYTNAAANSNFNWSQSGNSVIITTNSSQAAYINNLTFPVGNTFTLNGVSGAGVYTRG